MRRLSALVALILAAGCYPALALYCGSQLILEGMSKLQVLQRCGEPSYHESWPIYDQMKISDPRSTSSGTVVIIATPVGVMDHWIYNWGPGSFMQRLIFQNGALVSIGSLGYGQ
jgi:hypothetical protein